MCMMLCTGRFVASSSHTTDRVMIGFTALSKYYFERSNVNTGERLAFTRCVSHFLEDKASRSKLGTMKVNVAWDESDFQIDVGTPAGRHEYKRIIDRNHQLGVTHMVYGPRNTLHSNILNDTDDYKWEHVLWFSLGEQIREGRFDPATDPIPNDILDMVHYARSKNVSLLAYVYPLCVHWSKFPEAWVGGWTDISMPGVKDWLLSTLKAFIHKTGAKGFASDCGYVNDAPDNPRRYSQWRAWQDIIKALRKEFPDIIMDHRSSAHKWGPWHQLSGSYDEPLSGDENPETYGVPIASLSTDHVAADMLRQVNYKYAAFQLIPAVRIPGFMFHQTERTADNGTSPCFYEKPCFNNNTRDFDLLGYKYSVISNIGTAGLNNVLCMIPARDFKEYSLFPKEDLHFISKWLRWTDEHISYLENTVPIATLDMANLGSVDGTAAMASSDEGFLFLFNPNLVPMSVSIVIDESIGISNSSRQSSWVLSEIYPRSLPNVSFYYHSDAIQVTLEPSSAMVLSLFKQINVTKDFAGARTGVVGPAGKEVSFQLNHPTLIGDEAISFNGVQCSKEIDDGRDDDGNAKLQIMFGDGSLAVSHAMPLGDQLPSSQNTGGKFSTTFEVPISVFIQLMERENAYPIDWQSAERFATWLIPQRLLAYIFIANPDDSWSLKAKLDGESVTVHKAYNSRGVINGRTFTGFYLDLNELEIAPDVSYHLELNLPHRLPRGAFQGIFLHNLETSLTGNVTRCAIKTDS
uniref:Uncharacterized protein n=1 Tax=Lotharella globosa TaxID=91324 RepID=A0A7S4DUL7_9EUKA